MSVRCDDCGAEASSGRRIHSVRSVFRRVPRQQCTFCGSRARDARWTRSIRRLPWMAAAALALAWAPVPGDLAGPVHAAGWVWFNLGVLRWPMGALAILLHELGHAAVAWLLRFRVHAIQVGSGRTVLGRRLFGANLLLKDIPVGGLTSIATRRPALYRSRYWLVYAAGPAMNAAVAGIVLATAPASQLSLAALTGGFAPLIALALVNAWSCALSLYPVRYHGTTPSDGLGLLHVPFMSRAQVRDGCANTSVIEVANAVERDDLAAAQSEIDRCRRDHPDFPILDNLETLLRLRAGDWPGGEAAARRFLAREDLDAAQRPMAANNVAWAIHLRLWLDALPDERPALLAEAETLIAENFELAYVDPNIAGTCGAIRLDRGALDEAVPLLESAVERSDSPFSRAAGLAHLALAHHWRGESEAARASLEAARRTHPGLPLLMRFDAELARAGTNAGLVPGPVPRTPAADPANASVHSRQRVWPAFAAAALVLALVWGLDRQAGPQPRYHAGGYYETPGEAYQRSARASSDAPEPFGLAPCPVPRARASGWRDRLRLPDWLATDTSARFAREAALAQECQGLLVKAEASYRANVARAEAAVPDLGAGNSECGSRAFLESRQALEQVIHQLGWLARFYERAGRQIDAEASYRRAFEIAGRSARRPCTGLQLGPGPGPVDAATDLARFELRRGRTAEADAVFESLLSDTQERYGVDSAAAMNVLFARTRMLAAADRDADADRLRSELRALLGE